MVVAELASPQPLTLYGNVSKMSSKNFVPTYLYIKQHTITGKLYFGKMKSTRKDKTIDEYTGSGTHWKHHIATHGKQYVVTLWYCLFTCELELKSFALMCSKQWDIVNSDRWLNLRVEEGGNVDDIDVIGKPKSEITKHKMSVAKLGRKFTDEHKENMSKSLSIRMDKIRHTLGDSYLITWPIVGTNLPDPDRNRQEIVKNLVKFCEDNKELKLSKSCMNKVVKGKMRQGHHKGFIVERLKIGQ